MSPSSCLPPAPPFARPARPPTRLPRPVARPCAYSALSHASVPARAPSALPACPCACLGARCAPHAPAASCLACPSRALLAQPRAPATPSAVSWPVLRHSPAAHCSSCHNTIFFVCIAIQFFFPSHLPTTIHYTVLRYSLIQSSLPACNKN